MMGIPNEYQLKFNSIKDAKKLLEAVEKRFTRNAATRKTQRNLLKQNKSDLDTMSMDDIYNNLKVYEPEVKEMSSSSSSTQNMAFVSSSNNNTSSTNEAVNTAHGVSTASTQDLQQIHPDDIEEMDLRWQMAMLTMRARRFYENTRRKLTINGNETIGFDKSKVESYNCQKRGHFARECRAPRNQDNKNKESSRRSVPMEISTSTALVSCECPCSNSEVSNDSICSKTCLETIESLKSQNDQLLKDLKKSELMVLVPPPYIRNFMPPTPDLSFTGLDEFVNKPVVENYKAMSREEEPKVVRKNDDAPIIEEWVSDDEEEDVSQPKIEKKTVRPNDYSRFTWVFFLATKDETSGILKSFINGIENLVDHKVKVIRCDNGTKFKNREMNQFCEMKGILRQFSVARTPQQNRVAERRNRTLIEAARTMLSDSKLPTTFWAEAVNTACYNTNFRVMRHMWVFLLPFSITIDHKANFNGKADKGSGPDWLFDIDALTRTMNYEPIVTDPKSSHDDGSKPSSDDGKKVDEDPRKKVNLMIKRSKIMLTTLTLLMLLAGKTSIELPFDLNMPALEDYSIFDFSRDDEDDGAMADMNNLDTTI
ncbi:ribonuclease H-like domain-containing protein [Tanacetum coccineum]